MRSALRLILLAAAAALLTACGAIDSAAYLIQGPQHSLTLTRTQPYIGSSEWELDLVAARNRECMRRHKLQPASGDFKVELYLSLEGSYILRQGNNWYVTETQQCRLQQFRTPPLEPGYLLGDFEEKDGVFKFVAAAMPALSPTPTPAPAAAPPAAPAAR